MNALDTAVTATRVILGTYGLLYISSAILKPAWFHQSLAVGTSEKRWNRVNRFGGKPYGVWARVSLTLAACAYITYCAAHAVTFAIPSTWGSYNSENDAWISTRDAVGSAFAFWGMALPPALERSAARLADIDTREDV